jgi:hypothetical protein
MAILTDGDAKETLANAVPAILQHLRIKYLRQSAKTILVVAPISKGYSSNSARALSGF